MYSEYSVFKIFKETESIFKDKKLSIPKDWDKYKNKFKPENLIKLEQITNRFNTVWQNIDISSYFKVGFELFKTFNIDKFDHPQILLSYIIKDKKRKRDFQNISNITIKNSIKYIVNSNKTIEEYCNSDGYVSLPVRDFLKNNIDMITLIYLIEEKYLKIKNNEWPVLSYLHSNYTEIKHLMYSKHSFIKKEIIDVFMDR